MSSLDSRISSNIQKLRVRWQIFEINCLLLLPGMLSVWLVFLLGCRRISLFVTISFSPISSPALGWRVGVGLLDLMLSSFSLRRLRYLLNGDCFLFWKTHLSIIIRELVGYAHREHQKSLDYCLRGSSVGLREIVSVLNTIERLDSKRDWKILSHPNILF